MKASIVSLLGFVLAAGGVCAGSPTVTLKSAAVSTASRRPVLEKGMSGEMIRSLIGAPDEIKPMTAAGVAAETWLYRRFASHRVQPMLATEILTYGPGCHATGGGTPVSTVSYESMRIYQVTALLLVDGQLVLGRQWNEATRTYDR